MVKDISDVGQGRVKFCDQSKFKRSVQLLNFESYVPVGDHEDV